MEQIHSLLNRQVKRYFKGRDAIPEEWQGFIEAVNDAYRQSDSDRNMLERSMELSSQELLQANSELRAIFQALPDLFLRLDNEGTILDHRGGMTNDICFQVEELLGKRIHELPFENVGNKFLEAIHQVRETNSMVSIEFSIRIQEQENFYEARLLPLLEDQIIAIVRNITARKRMLGELLKVQKLESIGILAGGIAHDFNNMLTAILGNISFAKMYANPEDKICERLTEAEKASLLARNLTQQLLTFSKGGQPIVKTASVTKLLKDTTGFALTGSNVQCEFSMSEDLWPVEIDEGQMSQVINNLVINAVKSMPTGGTIKVRAEKATVGTERTKQSLSLEGENYVKISIQDQGIGIPEEYLQKIFDPYFTTRKKGSGLGLAISYSIVQKHHGYITAESELGIGTTFHILLPASEKELITERYVKEIVRGEKGRVLIMDDEEIVRDVASRMLKHIGYEVDVAKDGAEAIALYEQAQESQFPFNVVILDLTVPGGMGGKEAIEKLIELNPQAKAIVSSGYSTDPVMSNFREYGFSSVVSKPYKIEELSEALHKAR
ncbi:MAG: ATP-binding protein [Deltaproteobacteria bacterium]|nr:ATP-binding protein [Deltaproteobacteria bacterium]MDL1960485.1 ATP-binding protein [Deltaproteobacteria bacterium]